MYHRIARQKLTQNFQKLNQGDYLTIVKQFGLSPHHRVAGDSALGGERHTRNGVEQWYERLFTIFPNIQFSVKSISIKGLPWNTAILVHFDVSATLQNGQPYTNSIEQNITLKWGKIVFMDINEDAQKLANALIIQAQHGIHSASAQPVIT